VDIPERKVAALEWRGVPREAWTAFCDEWGLDGLRDRPHHWRD
jgi:hypothetical protein